MQVEICCNSVLSARNAKMGGATRIELCQALGEGGTTPSAAAIEYCTKELGLETRVLIRPRGGNFCYDKEDTRLILRDIALAREFGASAVVIGFLTENGNIDVTKTRAAVEEAGNMSVTFHRAFDECVNPEKALEEIINCGCDKLLTSGCQATAMEGVQLLKKLKQLSKRRIGIIAASGIVPENVAEIVRLTGVEEVHGSCKRTINGISLTDSETVRRLIENTNN